MSSSWAFDASGGVASSSPLSPPSSRNGKIGNHQPEYSQNPVGLSFQSSNIPRLVSTRLRGGSAAVAVTTSTAKTAYACAAFLGINGLLLYLLPNAMMKDLYKIERPNNEASKALSKDLLQVIGSVSFGVALLIGGTMIRPEQMTMEKMLGISFVPRLMVIASKLGTYPTKLLKINTLLMAGATGAMLSGKGLAAKVFPSISLVKALLLRWKPQAVAKKALGVDDIDAEEMKQSKALLRGLSNEILTSSVFQLLLGMPGMEAGRAAGWTCALWIVLLADMGFLDKTWKLMDASGPLVQVIHLIISSLLATGFFLKW